jgi:hypothetical protein
MAVAELGLVKPSECSHMDEELENDHREDSARCK